MSSRVRKLIGMLAILAFLTFYVMLASKIGDYVPAHWAAQLAYYAFAGTLWGLPLFPLIRWMEWVPHSDGLG